jgi:hypothetical protein
MRTAYPINPVLTNGVADIAGLLFPIDYRELIKATYRRERLLSVIARRAATRQSIPASRLDRLLR